MDIASLRQDYRQAALNEEEAAADAIAQFKQWFEQAAQTCQPPNEPNAMSLATVDAQGQPDARIVLLKGVDERGFTFFTCYSSDKGKQLAANPAAALVFHWPDLERQVRIRGEVSRLPDAESNEYFQSRPRDSQISAIASKQSSRVPGREALEMTWYQTMQFLGDHATQKPFDWGGYVLAPRQVEFWQGRPNRLHDRLLYTRTGEDWKIERLSP
jgi:pyridoxamine 5'-phosphate oxidase